MNIYLVRHGATVFQDGKFKDKLSPKGVSQILDTFIRFDDNINYKIIHSWDGRCVESAALFKKHFGVSTIEAHSAVTAGSTDVNLFFRNILSEQFDNIVVFTSEPLIRAAFNKLGSSVGKIPHGSCWKLTGLKSVTTYNGSIGKAPIPSDDLPF